MLAYRPVAPIVTVEVLLLEELRAHLRLDDHESDAAAKVALQTATIKLQRDTHLQLIQQKFEIIFPKFVDRLDLPRPPLVSVEKIEYFDELDALQTLATTFYNVEIIEEPGYVYLAPAQSWPATIARPDAVKITFDAGFGTTASAIPEDVKHAIRMQSAYYFENPGATSEASPPGYEAIVMSRRVPRVG